MAIFPILFLYTYNIDNFTFNETLIPLVANIVLASLLWFFLALRLKNKEKAGI